MCSSAPLASLLSTRPPPNPNTHTCTHTRTHTQHTHTHTHTHQDDFYRAASHEVSSYQEARGPEMPPEVINDVANSIGELPEDQMTGACLCLCVCVCVRVCVCVCVCGA